MLFTTFFENLNCEMHIRVKLKYLKTRRWEIYFRKQLIRYTHTRTHTHTHTKNVKIWKNIHINIYSQTYSYWDIVQINVY